MTTAMIDGSGADRELEAAICKIYGSESMWYTVNECIQIMGGMGYVVPL
jgi:alkylation response protein AidB-like acyl-CoA dehydrogenase